MSDTIIFEGPDGRLYEIPAELAGKFAVPGERVPELRSKLGASAANGNGNSMPAGHFRPGEAPPGFPPPPVSVGAAATGTPPTSTTIATPGGGTIVLNFFFGGPGPGSSPTTAATQVEGYHMTFDAHGIPMNHTEMLWGDYIDKTGSPAVGWHSHDPVTGNAQ